MNLIKRLFSLPLCMLVLGVGLAAGYQSLGGRSLAMAMPAALAPRTSAVVTVDLARVLDNLQQRADAEARFKSLAEGLTADKEKKDAELKQLNDQMAQMDKDGVPPESEQRQELEERAMKMMLNYQAWTSFTNDKLDVEQSLLLQDLYRSIKAAVAEMSAAEGFDIVLVNDSQGELGVNPESRVLRKDQIKQQMIARRMLYASPAADITDDLIARMNNAHNAGK